MSPVGLTEDELVEQPALRLLSGLGWGVASGFEEVLGSGGTLGRDSQSEPVLGHRLRDSLRTLNPGVPEAALDAAVERLVGDRSVMGRVRANREVYVLLREGARVETAGSDGHGGRWRSGLLIGTASTGTIGWRCRSFGLLVTCTSGGPMWCCL